MAGLSSRDNEENYVNQHNTEESSGALESEEPVLGSNPDTSMY